MSDELRVEFKIPTGRRRAPKTQLGEKAERQRVDRAARKARNLALAYWIGGLICSGQVESLAAVARMCGVSRTRVSQAVSLREMSKAKQWQLLGTVCRNR